MGKALSTVGTTLKYATAPDIYSFSELVKIKEYPDMGGAPEMLESTDLQDSTETHVLGVQSNPGLEFLSNYTESQFLSAVVNARENLYYRVDIEDEDGLFFVPGQHESWVVGAGVNALRDFRTMIAPKGKIETWLANIVDNGTFEEGLDDWTSTNGTLDTAVSKIGDNSVNFAESGSITQSIIGNASYKYRIGLWFRRSGTATLKIDLGSETLFDQSDLPSGEWVYVELKDIEFSGTETLSIEVLGTGGVNIDGISVIEYV